MAAPAGGDYHKSIERQRTLINHALTLATQSSKQDMSLQPQLTASQHGHHQLGEPRT